jgi:hypothetical protein
LWQNSPFFLLKKKSQAKWSRQLFGNFSMNLFIKSPRFLEDLCRFLAFFFFWNCHV